MSLTKGPDHLDNTPFVAVGDGNLYLSTLRSEDETNAEDHLHLSAQLFKAPRFRLAF